jgi:SPP1 gp7 family putative phage head morphogenesis protein
MNGLTTDQIVRTLRGTAAAKFTDGVLQRSRRSIEMTTRTALNHTANVAREEIYKRNSDIISGVRWVSTLDTRTSDICIALDGQVFVAGEGPRPPAHPNCRSCTTPITKSWKELGFNIDELPPATRASMDGQVPATETYGSWLSRQSEATQNDVLGVGRAQLFRDGAVTVDKFVDDVGKPLTLAQLQSIDNRAAVNVGDIKPTKSQVALQKLADIPAIDGPTIKTIFQQVVDKKLENEISSLVNKISKSQLDNAGIQVIDFKDIRVFDKAMFRPTIATFLTDGIPNVPNALDAIAFKLDGKYYMMSRSSIHRAAAQHLLGDEIKARVVDLDSIRTAGAVQSTLKDFKPEAGSFDILQLQGQSRESIKKALEDHRHISRDTHKLLPGYIDDSSDLVLSDYTSNAYEAVNTFLRTGKSLSGDTEAITEMVSEIKSLMKPVKDDMLLYRGISEKYLGAEEKLQMASLKPGDTFQSSGFTSMSRSPMTSYSFANGSDSVMFAVRAKSGFNAIITNEHEAEVILPHGSSFRVIEVTTTVHPRTGERVKTFIMDIVKTAVKAFEFIEVKAASKNSDAERFGDYFIGKVKQA